jgi:hypothetical protein
MDDDVTIGVGLHAFVKWDFNSPQYQTAAVTESMGIKSLSNTHA